MTKPARKKLNAAQLRALGQQERDRRKKARAFLREHLLRLNRRLPPHVLALVAELDAEDAADMEAGP
jgi:hypothetical protein